VMAASGCAKVHRGTELGIVPCSAPGEQRLHSALAEGTEMWQHHFRWIAFFYSSEVEFQNERKHLTGVKKNHYFSMNFHVKGYHLATKSLSL